VRVFGREGKDMAKTTEMVEVAIEELKPYERNAKIHGEAQIEKLKASIQEFGFLTPCLIDSEFNLIAGHGRVMAAKELNMESVPCVFIEGLTETQRKAYILADNRLGELGEWDFSIVDSELLNLNEMDFDVTLTGFDLPMEETVTEIVEDEPPEEPQEERCKLGDLWQLGEHRLICGDSTDVAVIDKLMDGVKADMLFTSPPYSDMREYNGGKDLSVCNLQKFINVWASPILMKQSRALVLPVSVDWNMPRVNFISALMPIPSIHIGILS
jgi:hypothetical protein